MRLQKENKKLKRENKEWEQSFDLYHKAAMRGTELFRKNHPDYPELSVPDTGKMIEDLCNQIDTAKMKNAIEILLTKIKDAGRSNYVIETPDILMLSEAINPPPQYQSPTQ